MSLQVGDVIPTVYELRDVDGNLTDATVTATATDPDGTAVTHTTSHPETGRYLGAINTSGGPAGVWRWTWSAAGVLTDSTDGATYVAALGTALPWEPSPRTVAALVPTRTLNQSPSLPTDPTYTGTFTDATIPTAVQVDGLVAQAIAWVAGSVGTVLPAFYGLAEAAAAMRAAGLILTAYPLTEDGAPEGTAKQWLDQADAALEQLVAANGAAGGTGPGDIPAPVGAACFPDPLPWLEPASLRSYPQPW